MQTRQDQIIKLRQEIKYIDQKLNTTYLSERYENIFVMGLTGAGKSSFISYIMRNRMTYEIKESFGKKKYKIFNNWDCSNEIIQMPQIGNKFISSTSIPKLYTNYTDKVCIYDTPGGSSTNGIIDQIRDSYSNSKIFKQGNEIKLVFLIDYASLQTSRGQSVRDGAEKIKNLLPNEFKQIMSSACIVVSKIEAKGHIRFDQLDENIEEIMIQQKSKQREKSQIFDAILKIVKEKRIICFPSPENISDTYVNQVFLFFKNIPSYKLKNNGVCEVSPNGKVLIDKFGKQVLGNIKNLIEIIGKKITQNDMSGKNSSIIKKQIERLTQIKVKISAVSSAISTSPQLLQSLTQSFQLDEERIKMFYSCLSNLSFCNNLYQRIDIGNIFLDILTKVNFRVADLNLLFEKIEGKENTERMRSEMQQNFDKTLGIVRQENQKSISTMNKTFKDLYEGQLQNQRKQLNDLKHKFEVSSKQWQVKNRRLKQLQQKERKQLQQKERIRRIRNCQTQ